MAKEAIQEVDEIEDFNKEYSVDSAKREDYLSRMLVDSVEMLSQQ